MRLTKTSDLWWKNAVVYCLDVETYADGNGDGCGDFRGLIQQVDHLQTLGVTCIWLMPFYPSPDRDDGYDISDYYSVDPRLGTLGEFVEFMRTARDRGIRVIADLVVNHTSDQHPWFQQARSSRDNPYRDWYVWADQPPADGPQGITFPDKETSLWQFDDEAGQYYLHRFYKFQPDLNIDNPAVRDEIARIIGFWMELGLSGFRVDAVPFLLENAGQLDRDDLPDPHDYLADLRAFLNRRNGEAVLLGEVNLAYPDTLEFFGEHADELTMCFDFIGMQRMYLSLARGDAGPLAEALKERPQPPEDAHWATFVRNHDELTLDKLSEAQRKEVFDALGPKPDMQLYGRGLRRRLPPMVEGDQRRIRLVYSLLFALPGTPVLFYGEEIGMGENLDIEGRLAVRVPMQWTAEPGAGFSSADPSAFPRPLVEGPFSPAHVNVRDQSRDPESALAFFRRLIKAYRACPELAWGQCQVLDPGPKAASLLVTRTDVDGVSIVTLHNVGARRATAELALTDLAGCDLYDVLAATGEAVRVGDDGTLDVPLPPYGFQWLRSTP
ncbi:MAG TPA: alpha-amylase family protein [Pseudonocardia sp.]